MKPGETWKHIHSERSQMADTWTALSAPQWAAASWCQGWSVQDTAGHIVAAAEQTPVNFYKELTAAGFKFNVFTDRGARRVGSAGPDELVRRLRARITTTTHPPAPVNLLIGSKRRIAGLRLQATDAEWAHGDGPEVSGPLLSLILAMTGRKAVHPDLSGDGVAELGRRP